MIEEIINVINTYGGIVGLSAIGLSAASIAIAFKRKNKLDPKLISEIAKLKADLEKQLNMVKQLSKAATLRPEPVLNYEDVVMQCPKHGKVKPIVLPDSTIICPYGHRLWPPELPFEKASSLNVDVKENTLEAKYYDLQSQIDEIKEKLQELEELSMAGTVIAKGKSKRKAEELEEELEEE